MGHYQILFVSRYCYLDDSNGAAVSSRDLLRMLAARGWEVEALSSIMLDLDVDEDPVAWFGSRGWSFDVPSDQAWNVGALGVRAEIPPSLRLVAQGVPVTLYCGGTTKRRVPDEYESREFIRLYHEVMDRFRPDVVLGYGGDQVQRQVFAHARRRGAATIFNLHNCQYHSMDAFVDVDSVRVPSFFAANHYRRSLGLECTVIPNPIQTDRIQIESHEPKYLAFINPSIEKGMLLFARIADELGRRRPDIPLLAVEGRATESDIAACGLDLRIHGNVFLMSHTPDPRRIYRVSRAVLMPSLIPETFGRVAAEAMCN